MQKPSLTLNYGKFQLIANVLDACIAFFID